MIFPHRLLWTALVSVGTPSNTKRVQEKPKMFSFRFLSACLAVLVAIAATGEAFSFAGGLKARAKADLIDKVESGASNEEVLKAIREVETFSILGGADLKNPLLPGNWLMVW